MKRKRLDGIYFVILREYREKEEINNMISFFTVDIIFKTPNKKRYAKWIRQIAMNHQKTKCDLSIVFCSDSYLLELNRKFLKHNYFTDVITFDHSYMYKSKKIVAGDIFISIDTVTKNRAKYNVSSFEEELLRVIAHGLLHLLGYDDICKDEKEIMLKNENEALLLYGI